MASKFRVLHAALLAAIIAFFAVGVAAQRPVTRGKSSQAPGRVGEVAKNGITEEQKANVRERVALATQIVNKHEAEARALGLSDGWRRAQLESLLPLSLESLREVEYAPDMDSLAAAVSVQATAPQAIGSTTDNLVYTPITPCRYIDTRNIGGRINGFRGYDLALSGSSYGGSGACNPQTIFGVDDDAFGAIVMNATIVSPTAAPGFLAIKPTEAAPVTSLLNWYQAGATVQMANQGIVTPEHVVSVVNDFVVQTSAPTHVIIDVFGAFLQAEVTALQTTTVQVGVTCPSGGSICQGIAICPAGYRLTGGGVGIGSFVNGFDIVRNGPPDGAAANNQQWICSAANSSGTTQNFQCSAICAQTPGR